MLRYIESMPLERLKELQKTNSDAENQFAYRKKRYIPKFLKPCIEKYNRADV